MRDLSAVTEFRSASLFDDGLWAKPEPDVSGDRAPTGYVSKAKRSAASRGLVL